MEKVQILYQKGLTALQSKNWDYAITLFTEVLSLCPENSSARTNLRLAEFRKFETRRFPLWYKISSRIFKITPYIKAFIYWYKKNWAAVLQELEKPLRVYPKNLALLRRLADAAENAGLLETACGIYETIYIIKPTDISTLKKLGKHYHTLNQLDKARSYYEKAVSIAPLDYEARKGLQDLAALGTIAKGWEEAGTYRGKIQNEKELASPIKDIEKQLTEQPDDAQTIKKLAKLYISIEDYDKALQLYERIKIPDSDIKKEIFNLKLAKLKGKPELQKKLILEETQARVKGFPTHLPLRYEMGIVYMENGMIESAIGEFQLSVKDPKYRILSLNKLGLCFYKKGLNDLAINQFIKASSELYEWDELKKEVIYNLGTVYETMGEKEKALAEYKKIYAEDIHYRNIALKIVTKKDSPF